MSREAGRLGEDFAAHLLKKEGYRIAARNFTSRYGEIDIVAEKEDILAFVEVKTRSPGAWGLPAQAVTRAKRHKIIATAYIYLQKRERQLQPRFDIFEVFIGQAGGGLRVLRYRYLTNAFQVEDFHGLF